MMTNKNKKDIINIYYLNNINSHEEKSKLVALDTTKVLLTMEID